MRASRWPNSFSTKSRARMMEVPSVTSSCIVEMRVVLSAFSASISDFAVWALMRERAAMMIW